MDKKDALLLLDQAIYRIKHEPRNHGNRGWQCGGAYWRLADVLKQYLEPRLAQEEGDKHAEFLIGGHGKILIPK